MFGSVPIYLKEYVGKKESEESGKIDFSVKDEIPRIATSGRKDRKPDVKQKITRREYDLISQK